MYNHKQQYVQSQRAGCTITNSRMYNHTEQYVQSQTAVYIITKSSMYNHKEQYVQSQRAISRILFCPDTAIRCVDLHHLSRAGYVKTWHSIFMTILHVVLQLSINLR
jgi:hypothetical protein